MKILYVEDNPLDAELLVTALKRQTPPMDCRIAGSLKEGLSILDQRPDIDLALIDIVLPDGSGLELLKEIRQMAPAPATVILTGAGDEESAVAALKTGADDYIVKSDGYLQRLPMLLKDALSRFRDETRRRSRPLSVLYAESSVDDVELTRRHFSLHAPHIRVDTVPTAAGVMDRLNACATDAGRSYDVLLLDYRLPDKSALELIKEIRLEKGFDLPVVLATGHGSEETAVQALRLGFSDYVIKSSGYLFKLPGTLEHAYQSDQLRRERSRLSKSEAQNRFQAELLRNAPVIAAFYDLEYKIVWANRAYEDAAGLALDELVGKKCYAVWGFSRMCDACPVVSALETGEPRENELMPYSRKFGPESQRVWLSRGTPVRDDHGEIIGAIEFAVDITDRKKSEQERERLMTAIAQAGETVMITNAGGIIEYVNPAFEAVTGYSLAESIGKTPRILHSGKQDKAFYRNLWGTISQGRVWKGRMVNKRKDGTFYTEASTISAVRDAAGTIVNYVAVKRDISAILLAEKERDELQEQLLQAQKLESVGRLAGGIAHDFNNMLSIILGYGETIVSELRPEDPLRDDALEIVEAGKRSAALTRQLLAFSRKQTLQPVVLNLNFLIKGLEKMLARLIGEDIELEFDLCEDLFPVMADPGQVEQVIMNLSVNARDAMPRGGRLTIKTFNSVFDPAAVKERVSVLSGEYVVISMADTGCGMDKETLNQIFDPFFTTKEKGRGTGLGLSTVYGIIKQSNGNIRAYSEPGKGTTFRICLPRTQKDQQPADNAAAKHETRGSGEQILVVEDDEPLGRLCRRILISFDYEVTLVTDVEKALQAVAENGFRPDLLLTDVIMPGMSGKALAERLRSTMPDLKVLYMSGYTDDTIAHHGLLDSGTPFIQKPFASRALGEKVKEVLEGGRT